MNQDEFDAFIDEHVAALISGRLESFGDLVALLPGVYPTDVMASLSRLVRRSLISEELLLRMKTEVQQPGSKTRPPIHSLLPVPHPLDFCWRFTRNTSTQLLERCSALACPGETVSLLGAPSVALVYQSGRYHYGLMVIDSDPAVISSLSPPFPGIRLLCSDLTNGRVQASDSTVVIVDPPWYPEYMQHFLWVACDLCRLGGHVLVAFPPDGTRPSMEEERVIFDEWTASLGLRLLQTENVALHYCSPPFEQNALASCGIRNLPSDWRRAHLFLMRRETDRTVPRPPVTNGRIQWKESILNRVRIRVKSQPGTRGFVDPSLVRLVDGDILPSVSRRHPDRAKVDVWTSGNRVFSCRGPGSLNTILRAKVAGSSPHEMISLELGRPLTETEHGLVSRTAKTVEELVEAESAELQEQYEG